MARQCTPFRSISDTCKHFFSGTFLLFALMPGAWMCAASCPVQASTHRRASTTWLILYTRTFVALPASVVARKQEDWVKASCHHAMQLCFKDCTGPAHAVTGYPPGSPASREHYMYMSAIVQSTCRPVCIDAASSA